MRCNLGSDDRAVASTTTPNRLAGYAVALPDVHGLLALAVVATATPPATPSGTADPPCPPTVRQHNDTGRGTAWHAYKLCRFDVRRIHHSKSSSSLTGTRDDRVS
jgi:hypothetical protein